ncbi:autotransporter outer membrane beta-barrel domain-containing protein [Parasutterella secunda]|uniref:autotransporter outer membrane beta-barrel domain-containing protein n=1 Tax=Parasutterella secunda TaxID=626947 RepID=UPI002011EFB0|nr:autotransporter outer membrane beta-barrel domain-containing protein [Parasutterella secunda]MCL1596946.1 autotransporter outer membrane beta-barrel domain-containing protein [Parasutterella secunda]
MKSKQKYQLARLSAIATAVLMTSVFSTTNAATVKLNGTLFVNDQTQEFGEGGVIKDDVSVSASIGQITDDIRVEKGKSGDSLYAYGAKLTVEGSKIDVEGAAAAVYANKGSEVLIGSSSTDYVRLDGKVYGVRNGTDSSLVVNAKEINIGTTITDLNKDLISVFGQNNGQITIGQNAQTIKIQTQTASTSTYNPHVISGIKALDGANITLGNSEVNDIDIKTIFSNNATGIWAEGKESAPDSSIEAAAKYIFITTEAGHQASGISALHGGDISIGAEDSLISLTTISTGTQTEDALSSANGIQVYSSLDNHSSLTMIGTNITSNATGNIEAVGAYIGTNGTLNIGTKETDQVLIKAINTQSNPSSRAFGIWVDNTAEWKKNGGQANITGQNVSIYAEGGTDTRAIHVASNDLDPAKRSKLSIKADNIVIEAKSTNAERNSSGISAMSAGDVSIEGNTIINADNAIVARGDASVVINKETQSTTQINGDISFSYDEATSGTGVDATVDITLSGENSYLEGQSKITGNPPQEKSDVKNFSMTMTQGGTWKVTGDSFVNHLNLQDAGSVSLLKETGTFSADNLSMDGGVIQTSSAEQKVEVQTLKLSQNGGTFNASSVANQDGSISTATLSVGSVEEGQGGALNVNYSGINSDQITEENVSDLQAVQLAETADGIAMTEVVEEGDINGKWTRTTTADGQTNTTQAANTKLADYSSVNAMSLVQWRNEINHLTKRLGEVRASESAIGAWARVYGGESEWGSGDEISMDHTTIQVGSDYRINPNLIVGGAFSYTDSDADLVNGSADGKSYSLAAYATYLTNTGSYLDVIGRYGYLKNDIHAGNMKLDTDSNAFSLSMEGGHTFRFLQERAYIEPQVELTYGFISGDNAKASNQVKIEQDDYQSLITRLGVRAGMNFPEKAGTVYATVSYSYDFLGEAEGKAIKNNLTSDLSEDLGGGWVTYGVGTQFQLGKQAYVYGELERTSGGDVENPYLFNVGLRWNF